MQYEWILDVLADLKAFARQNGLNLLAEQLDDTQLIAATELTSKGEGHPAHERSQAAAAGSDPRGAGRRY